MSEQGEKSPYALLTKEIIEAVVKKDLGSQWNLAKFEIKDFTKKGDNFTCKVTSVCCKVVTDEEERVVSYVAKLNPKYSYNHFDQFLSGMFESECGFLSTLGLKLNEILEGINLPTINFPNCLFSDTTYGNQMLISSDLREQNFEMFDRKLGMDYNHVCFVVKELAKLHAASMILKETIAEKVLDLYPFLHDSWLDPGSETRETFSKRFTNSMKTSLKLIENVEGYDEHRKWLENITETVLDKYSHDIFSGSDEMKVICHGDCWNNNVLFRYGEDRKPTDIYLVDLQLCRYGSLALDLNYLFFTSLTGEVRNACQEQLLSDYYGEFEKIMKAANKPMKFTEEKLKEEMKIKAFFGIISGLSLLPFVISESDDVPDINAEGNNETLESEFRELIMKAAHKSPIFKTRFLSLFDDAEKLGLLHD